MSQRYAPQVVLMLLLALAWAPAWGDFASATAAYQKRDYSAAYAGFLPLAEAGDPRAQTVIALMHKYGESVPPDPAVAFSWYRKAAESGYGPAQFYVGEMYADGLGVTPDRDEAIQWLSKAAAQGFKRANTRLSDLSADPLDPETRKLPGVQPPATWNFRLPNEIRNDPDGLAALPDATYLAQVGAIGTRAGANRLWEWFTVQAPGLFEDRDPIVALSGSVNRRLYIVAVGPFDDLQQATSFCENLQQRIREAGCQTVAQD